MRSRFACVVPLLFTAALCGCATPASQPNFARPLPSSTSVAWKAQRHHPHIPKKRDHAAVPLPTDADQANEKRAQILASLKQYSAAWWVVHDEIEAENDRQLNRKLLICRGCSIPQASTDQTGSIAVR
jgi:hypothetical protein